MFNNASMLQKHNTQTPYVYPVYLFRLCHITEQFTKRVTHTCVFLIKWNRFGIIFALFASRTHLFGCLVETQCLTNLPIASHPPIFIQMCSLDGSSKFGCLCWCCSHANQINYEHSPPSSSSFFGGARNDS